VSAWRSLAFALVAAAQGGCSQDLVPPPEQPSARVSLRKIPVRRVAGTRVFDAAGVAHACQAPLASCSKTAIEREFLDDCRLHGYFVRQCGCSELCTGRVPRAKHYDARGAAKECAPERPECTPAETSSAFQDACAERGHRLVLCGCEWLCSGPLQ
jgi:hypothetical protein